MSLNQIQKDFFRTKKTWDLSFRSENLKKLKNLVKEFEPKLINALKKDLNKSAEEAFITEISLVYSEIDLHLKKMKKWSRRRVGTNLLNIPARSEIIQTPYGATLIFGAWNYPVNLTLMPLVGALSAGNTVVLKPSEMASETSKVLAEMINTNFEEKLLHVVEGGADVATALLEDHWDYVFYTGGERVGKIIAESCAKKLTPYTLELGGKSPCVILDDVDLPLSIKRILWGKFLNNGQTCIAPDYLLVPSSIKQKVMAEIKKQINLTPMPDVKIINKNHFDRLKGLVSNSYFEKHVEGENRLGPIVIDVKNPYEEKVMQEEIFGPLIPVVDFDTINEMIGFIESKSHPLALYLFTKNAKIQDEFKKLSFGGAVFNDVIMHISNPYLPFGGVGVSGVGAYHGEWSFKTFSHAKSVMTKPMWFDPFVKYPPFTSFKMAILKLLMK